jgi:hypothetical protein
MNYVAVVFALGASACAEPVFEMKLKPPTMPSGFDLSCVTAVDVQAHEPFDEEAPIDIGLRQEYGLERAECVDITPSTTWDAIRSQLAGQVSLDLPDDGLAGVQIRGRTGTCNDSPNFHEAIFYGAAPFNDGDMNIPVTANISCNARETYKVRPLELAAMIADPVHACRTTTDAIATFPGNIRPSLLAPELPPLTFEAGTGVALLAAGTAMVQSFSGAMSSDTCVALAHEGNLIDGVTCVNKNAPTLCGMPGEIEVPVYPFVFASTAINPSAYGESGTLVLGSVWETNPNKPVENAVVTTTAPNVKIEYLALTNNQPVVMPGATKTGPSGLFMVYSSKIITVSIAAPGHQTRTMTVGGGWELDGSVLAVLPKM